MVLLLRCLHRRKSVPVFEQENPRFCRSLPCFSDDSEFLHRVSLLELRVRDASNSGDGCSAVSSCTSPARSPGEQNIVGPQVLFSTLGRTDSDRRPRGNPAALGRGNAGAHVVRRLAIPGDSSGVRGTQARDVLPRPGGGQSSHSVEAAVVLVGLMGARSWCVFLRVGAPQIQLNNRDVSTMSWAMLRIINRVVELQGPGGAFCHQLCWRLAPFA